MFFTKHSNKIISTDIHGTTKIFEYRNSDKIHTLKHENQDDQLTKKWLKQYTKPCPNCSIPIEKSCNNLIRCTLCKYKFCWRCLKPWHDYMNQCIEQNLK